MHGVSTRIAWDLKTEIKVYKKLLSFFLKQAHPNLPGHLKLHLISRQASLTSDLVFKGIVLDLEECNICCKDFTAV